MGSIRTLTSALALGAAVSILAAPSASASFHGDRAYALDAAGNVHTYALGNPGAATSRPLTGIGAGETVVGIDERPKTGALYAVTKGGGGEGRAYVVDPATGAASLAFALVQAGTATPVLLTGATFGVDFNPAADALRIIGDDGQNLRALPSDRVVATVQRFAGDTFTDGTLSYSPITTSPRPAATGVNAAAYTNNDNDAATATTLFDIDTPNADLVAQNPPNDGTLTKVADLSIAGRSVQGFDISGASLAFVALGNARVTLPPRNVVEQVLQLLGLQGPRTELRTQLSTVNLATGALSPVGTFATNRIVDIAVDTPAP